MLIVLGLTVFLADHTMAQESEDLEIETPEGPIPTTLTAVEPGPQEIHPVSDDVQEMFRDFETLGPEFARHYVPDSSASGLKLYDEAFRAWQLAEPQAHSDQQVVEVLGSILGNRLVEDFDMEWVLVDDAYGTDYAVRAKSIDVMAFPFSSVLKRINSGEDDFMYGVYYAVKDRIDSGEYAGRQGNSQVTTP